MNNDFTRQCGAAWMGWLLFVVLMLAVFAVGVLFASVLERRQEALVQPPRIPVDRFEVDSAKWAANWPREYASYSQMKVDQTRTRYAGAFPRDYLEETPANVVLFAGYGFAQEYLQARGHWYAVDDVTSTKRLADTTPATCWTCKSPDVPRLMAQFSSRTDLDTAPMADLVKAGSHAFYERMFVDLKPEITHPIGCRDCHEPDTMRLTITRPGLIEAFERQGKDINAVSHQEMRSLVCAQCHVEYYFKDKKYLTFPWDKGMTPESMVAYYTESGFEDWTHAISKAPMIKMQHPDYEVYSAGIHAYRDVACADCHMPYVTEGGAKYSSHHLQSPLLNISTSCAVCHRWSEDDIRLRVESIQDKNNEARKRAEKALSFAHFDVAACLQSGAPEAEVKPLQEMVRQAQMRWDYVAANNGMGFHAPAECLRVLGASVDMAQECRVLAAKVLARHGYLEDVQYPDVSTKEKAQAVAKLFVDGAPPLLLKAIAPAQQGAGAAGEAS